MRRYTLYNQDTAAAAFALDAGAIVSFAPIRLELLPMALRVAGGLYIVAAGSGD